MPIPVPVAADGFCHPATESELIGLMKWAHDNERQVRVRGSAHSFPQRAIYNDRPPGQGRAEVAVMLDRYRAVRWIDTATGEVEVEAGCHLSFDPRDPDHGSTLENGLVIQLQKKGFALPDLGGITHQTVGGFLSTGSSGGSAKFGIEGCIKKIRFIDGKGNARDALPATEIFDAVGVSMGLLGVISTVTFKCIPTFNIEGSESTTAIADCSVDLFGDGIGAKPGLEAFLRDTDYARFLWWPQDGVERIVLWQAKRLAAVSGFRPEPYQELGRMPLASEVLAALVLSIIGNLNDLSVLPEKLEAVFEQLDESLLEGIEKLGFPLPVAEAFAKILSGLMEMGADGMLDLPGMNLIAGVIKANLPAILPRVYGPFVPLDADQDPPGPKKFSDYWWHGLPMDNGIDDRILPTFFTELWIPIGRTKEVMCELRDFFQTGPAATGTYAFEIYAANPSPFWMSGASGKVPVIRIDVFWFGYNAGAPDDGFFPQFWHLLRKFDFKPHWGKFLPRDPPPDKEWARYFSQRFANWSDFLRVRKDCDPENLFLTAYWREHLGLEDDRPPRPVPAPRPERDPFSTAAWLAAGRAVVMHSWLLIIACVYGLLVAHVPFLLGGGWSTCQPPQTQSRRGCLVALHFLEVPVVGFLTYLAWHGLKRLRAAPSRHAALVSFGASLLAVLVLFETSLILDALRRGAPSWEVLVFYTVAAMMAFGVAVALHVRIRVAAAIEPLRKPAAREIPLGW